MMRKILFISICMLFIVACSDSDNEDGGQYTHKLSSLDIQDAAYLYIESGTTKSSTANILFKITKDGVVKEITYKDELGNELKQTFIPTQIINASNDYIILAFEREYYLVNKNNGAAYSLPLAENNNGFAYIESEIQFDSFGSMYFIIYNNKDGAKTLVKLNTTNPKNITYETLTPSHHYPSYFIIDKDNNLFYSEKNNNYALKDGVTTKFDVYNFWLGVDGYCYALSGKALNDSEENIIRTDFIYKVLYNDSELEFYFIDANNEYGRAMDRRNVYQIDGKLYLIVFSYNYEPQCKVFNVTNKESLSSAVYSCPKSFASNGIQSGNYIYALPVDEDFYRFNPVNGELNKIYSHDSDYEIYGDIKIRDGIVIFTAFQLSTGKNVMVEITEDGNKTTELGSVNKCTVLEKIR